MLSLSKNERIAETRKKTKERHEVMTVKSFEVKVLKNHLDAATLEKLTRVFIEAKWFTNDAIAQGPFNVNYKANKVLVKVGDTFEDREINILSSQMRQSIIDRYYASTQECSNCHKLNKIPLSQRVYICNYCGLTIDRDLNSGIDNDAKGHKEVMALGTTLMSVDDETTTVMLKEYSARNCEPCR